MQALCLEVVRAGLAASAHDCSDGGLAVALAECCIGGGLGARIALPETEVRLDAELFGESPSRIVLSATAANAKRIGVLAAEQGVPVSTLGAVEGDSLAMSARGSMVISLLVAEMEQRWRSAIRLMVEEQRGLAGADGSVG